MEKETRRGIFVYIGTVLFSILYLIIGNRLAGYRPAVSPSGELTATAVVTEILDVQTQTYTLSGDAGEIETKTICFRARLTGGDLKGTTVTAFQQQDSMLAGGPDDVDVGSRVILTFTSMDGEEQEWYFMEYHRSGDLIWLLAFFLVLLLLFGRGKGINTIVSLVFTCLAIFLVFLPSVLGGRNIYLWASVTCVYVIFMTLLITGGASRKSLCAGLGCLCGLAFSGVTTLIMDRIMHLTGLVDEQAIFLTMLDGHPIDLRAVIFGSILIGAMGAAMDVAMSLASSLQEVAAQAGERAGFSLLFRSGMNIGRDMMCTMSNTLILAYIGSSLSTVLLLTASAESALSLFNREMIVVEVLQAIAGSLGILFAIPSTSALAAWAYPKKPEKPEKAPRPSAKKKADAEMNGKYASLSQITARHRERDGGKS